MLYLDCFSGISGDMVLGAFLDAGLPLDELRTALGSLAVSGYAIAAERGPARRRVGDQVRRRTRR